MTLHKIRGFRKGVILLGDRIPFHDLTKFTCRQLVVGVL
jgi:hypothetical protein